MACDLQVNTSFTLADNSRFKQRRFHPTSLSGVFLFYSTFWFCWHLSCLVIDCNSSHSCAASENTVKYIRANKRWDLKLIFIPQFVIFDDAIMYNLYGSMFISPYLCNCMLKQYAYNYFQHEQHHMQSPEKYWKTHNVYNFLIVISEDTRAL